jgi:diaminopimelate epimerase
MAFHLASASGNAFAYVWDTLPPGAGGPGWARALGKSHGLDGLFLLRRPVPGSPWVLEHWDADGSATFCSNGTRAALAVPGAPSWSEGEVHSSGETVTLRRDGDLVGIRMPSGPGTGWRTVPPALEAGLEAPHAFGWIGNPQLVLERADADSLDLAALAPPLRHHPALPGGTNVNVLHILGPGTALIRSWERGVEGETLCCGTGSAVAGAWLARRTGRDRWLLQARGGEVRVDVQLADGGWRELWLTGPVQSGGPLEPPALP